MARLGLDVDVDSSGLARIQQRLQRARPALERIADDLQETQAARFDSTRFRKLNPVYERLKASRGLPRRPLAGGKLDRSVHGRGQYAVRRVGDDLVEVGTRDPVARLHRAGTTNMPRRNPVANPTKQVKGRLVERLRTHVLDDR